METRVWSCRSLRLGCALLLVLALCGLFLAIVQPQSQIAAHPLVVPDAPAGGTLYVAPGGDCNGMTPCYGTIQAAADAAEEESLIKIAAGTYTGVLTRTASEHYESGESVVSQVTFISKSLTLRGGYTPANWGTPDFEQNLTVVDAQGAGRAMFIDAGNRVTLEGLRLTGGGTDGLYVLSSDLTLNQVRIMGNRRHGLVFQDGTTASLWRSEITHNLGNGILVDVVDWESSRNQTIDVAECLIQGNSGWGIDAASYGAISLKYTTITHNSEGGFRFGSGVLAMEFNVIADNGGNGVYLNCVKGTMSGDYIARNANGVVLWAGYWDGPSDVELINAVIVDNNIGSDGIGVHCVGANARLLHSTVARNGAYGVLVSQRDHFWENAIWTSDVELVDTIVVGHDIGVNVTVSPEPGITNKVCLTGILWGTGVWANDTDWSSAEGDLELGEGHIWGNPGFVDPDAGDYHIVANSAARDAAGDAGVSVDMDGQFRPMDYQYDIGADEYPGPAVLVAGDPVGGVVNQGVTLTYTWDITNTGMEDLGEVVLAKTLSAWQPVVAVTSGQGHCSHRTDEVMCDLGALALGDSMRVTVVVQVSPVAPLGQPLTSWVAVTVPGAADTADSELYVQNCYARVNDDSEIYNNVQAAVDAANTGDMVKVAGFCVGAQPSRGIPQVVYLAKTLTLQGGYTPNNWETPDFENHPATLDGASVGRVLHIAGAGAQSLVEGFRIIHGYADNGAGIYGSVFKGAGLVLQHNQIISNTAFNEGGGVYLSGIETVLQENLIAGNSSMGNGGGVYFEYETYDLGVDLHLLENDISENVGQFGGGVYLAGSVKLERNYLHHNTAMADGGGIHFHADYHSPAISVIENTVVDNVAVSQGGGAYMESLSGTIQLNTFSRNRAVKGAGVYLEGLFVFNNNYVTENQGNGIEISGYSYDHTDMVNNLISHNAWHGVTLKSCWVNIVHTTITHNGTDGVYITGSSSQVAMRNVLFAEQSFGVQIDSGRILDIDGILWSNVAKPLLVQADVELTINNEHTGAAAFATDGYHIRAESAARDVGSDPGIEELYDIDGDLRPQGMGYDIGMDEVRVTAIVADEAVTMTYNTQGLTTTLDIPAGALGDVVALAQAPLGEVTPAPGELYVGEGFELVGYSNASRQLEHPLAQPVTMTVQYSDAAVRTLEDESDLYLAWWEGSGWVDAGTTCNQGTSYYVRDTGPYTTTNRIVTPVCRLGRFALFGPSRYVYMPVVLREQ